VNDKPNRNVAQPGAEPAEPTEPTDDTEGHYLASYEFARQVARERTSDREREAREQGTAREAKRTKKR
jgi:hypothetical protein